MKNEATAMQLERTACFRCELPWETSDPSPQEFIAHCREHLKFWKRYQWIPQTLGDQVWIWFEFETVGLRDQFVAQIPGRFKHFYTESFKQEDLNFWKGI